MLAVWHCYMLCRFVTPDCWLRAVLVSEFVCRIGHGTGLDRAGQGKAGQERAGQCIAKQCVLVCAWCARALCHSHCLFVVRFVATCLVGNFRLGDWRVIVDIWLHFSDRGGEGSCTCRYRLGGWRLDYCAFVQPDAKTMPAARLLIQRVNAVRVLPEHLLKLQRMGAGGGCSKNSRRSAKFLTLTERPIQKVSETRVKSTH